MKRTLSLVAAIIFIVAPATLQAQFTTNPIVYATTNTTGLASIGNGFGVALLGYGMPAYNPNLFSGAGFTSNIFFLALSGGQPSASDATVSGGTYQFYTVYSDKQSSSISNQADVLAFKVTAPVSNPGSLTIVRTWAARTETNNILTVQGASLGPGGITTNGIIALRADGTLSPNGNAPSQAIFTLDANGLSTIVISNYLTASYNPLVTNGAAGPTITFPAIGQRQGLISGTTFSNYQFVARADITGQNVTPTTTVACNTPFNNNANLLPHGQLVHAIPSRGLMNINDNAKVIATLWKDPCTDAVPGSGSDMETHLVEIHYTDNGTSITINSIVTNTFGTADVLDTSGTINTNAAEFFSATPFNGPHQISINDNGDMALAVSINCANANNGYNGTRSSVRMGIIYKPGGTTNQFVKVTDNSDPTLFFQEIDNPLTLTGTTNNIVSPPALDNFGNVFFEAAYTNTTFGGTNFSYARGTLSNALYMASPNTYPNPTSWTVKILLRAGDQFTEPVSGNTLRVEDVGFFNGSGTGSTDVPRTFGANGINRTPVPSSGNKLGGVVVCATMTNLGVSGVKSRFDGVLYVAPLVVCPTLTNIITSITRSGNDINLTYNAQTGTNIVQSAAGGNYTGAGFADLPASTNIVTGCPTSASFSDVGGAAGGSNNYYRVRLIRP